MVLRPPLGGENLCDRGGIGRIGAQAIDGFGGKGHQSARSEDRSGALYLG
jgi:hypothetical protein